MHQDKLRDIARESIQDLAPKEMPLFDAMWAEAMHDPALLESATTKSDRHLGAGSTADVTMMSLVIIPIVVAVARDLGVAAFKQVIDYVKKWVMSRQAAAPSGGQLSDAEIERIAEVIAQRFATRR